MAGASAFQIGSSVLTEGPGVFDTINCGLERFMEEYGYGSISDMEGAAHE
jgi:dihydroorotate dehydrogenase (NAD+) catalytic subunit